MGEKYNTTRTRGVFCKGFCRGRLNGLLCECEAFAEGFCMGALKGALL